MRGLIIAAPATGSGKTTLTLGLARAWRRAGLRVGVAKVGPDYIDPRFLEIASGREGRNLDPWSMRTDVLRRLTAEAGEGADLLLIEGVMGLFDGAADGRGSTADLAALLGLPVVLVLDARKLAHTAGAIVHGLATWRSDVRMAGVILNGVGSPSHETMLRESLRPTGLPVLGATRRVPDLVQPERHLGLVQAEERTDPDTFLDRAADLVLESVDRDALKALAEPPATGDGPPTLPPLGNRIAVASDTAFAFAYRHVLNDWRRAGATLHPFSPLADEGPDKDVDAVYLPGGYPELHAGRLAANTTFLGDLRAAAARRALVYGECGGFMTLGEGLIDANGTSHAMAGLLPVSTDFARRKLHLGYRRITVVGDVGPFAAGTEWRGHEFHYAGIVEPTVPVQPLFAIRDARGTDLGAVGAVAGSVAGSFIHLVDRS